MLQIPSSVSSLFSLSSKVLVGLCSGLFIGSKVAVTQFILSIPKDSFRATRTVETILLPTKCVLSSPSASFSYVASLGYVSFIFASVFCILRAKSFTRTSNGVVSQPPSTHAFTGVASQPPSPPPDPGSSRSANKKRGWAWLLWLIAILLGLVLLGLAGFYMLFVDHKTGVSLPALAAHSIQGLSFLERSFFDSLGAAVLLLSTVTLHISMHGWRYSKIVLLALVTHSACALIAMILERLRRRAVVLAGICWCPFGAVFVVPEVVIASSRLNWIFWMSWYWECEGGRLPTVFAIQESILRLPSRFSFLEAYGSVSVSMVVGPAIIHAATLCLFTVVLALRGIPCTARAVISEFSDRSSLLSFCGMCIVVFVFLVYFGSVLLTVQYMSLGTETQQLVWQWFSCPQSRAEAQEVYRALVATFQQWKSTQIGDFGILVSTLQGAFFRGIDLCLERWAILCWGHRLLIVAPAAIFYGYFYVIPAARKVRIWRRRGRRR
ncbi:hypothetical protein FB451DRAFT_1358813 [Mycena latifolia]|nr:hypothetical protein FB451DRAFT_1358813 [Mycena latifolia]